MQLLVPIVEGYGEVAAVPFLLRRVLAERLEVFDWEVSKALNAHGSANLSAHVQRLAELAARREHAGGILILGDLDNGCPRDVAIELGESVSRRSLPVPIAIVLARREYEAWLLASIETLSGRQGLNEGLVFEGEVEEIRDAKGLISERMIGGKIYKETVDQVKLTAHLDLALVANRSRSFRRLLSAVEWLVASPRRGAGKGVVSPVRGDRP